MKRLLYCIIFFAACKDVYNPPLKNPNTNYLVVEGNIIAGNDSTIIHLSRTVAVSDTAINKPETNANVVVESEDGESYILQNELNGVYDAAPLNINQNKKYRLHITTNGKEYVSDYVPAITTPPIDSVSWNINNENGVTVSVNTHDDSRSTLYYQWNFTETWQHNSSYTSSYIYEGDSLRPRYLYEYIHNCWTVVPSPAINIASTAQLSLDEIFEKPLVKIRSGSEKLSVVYSILVKQNALTKEGFEYWQNLQKNTAQIGTIFDPQPFADFGNIHCVSDKTEPVIGFISSCTVAKKRLYIYESDVPGWPYTSPTCFFDTIPPDSDPGLILGGGAFTALYLVSISGQRDPGYLITNTECADCRIQGGSTIKPPYMP